MLRINLLLLIDHYVDQCKMMDCLRYGVDTIAWWSHGCWIFWTRRFMIAFCTIKVRLRCGMICLEGSRLIICQRSIKLNRMCWLSYKDNLTSLSITLRRKLCWNNWLALSQPQWRSVIVIRSKNYLKKQRPVVLFIFYGTEWQFQ